MNNSRRKPPWLFTLFGVVYTAPTAFFLSTLPTGSFIADAAIPLLFATGVICLLVAVAEWVKWFKNSRD